jgi:ABC-2 type transport system ATP-binding protein
MIQSLPESDPAVRVEHLTHRYDAGRVALDDVSLDVRAGEAFALLGPNGSGKTTLFRILSTLIEPTSGSAMILGHDVVRRRDDVRQVIGVVFQSPSLDKQLTAEENLRHHGHLYGLRGAELKRRIAEALETFGVTDRARELTGTLSGGLRRRVELAKGMLTRPKVLLLDEPSTGLDPSARIELWKQLKRVRDEAGVTVLLTTHLMDEADRCDRLAILDRGRVRACDSPDALKDTIGGDVISIASEDPDRVRALLREKLNVDAAPLDGVLRLERRSGHAFVPQIIEAAPGLVRSISVGRPTLEDVFVHVTGHAFRERENAPV